MDVIIKSGGYHGKQAISREGKAIFKVKIPFREKINKSPLFSPFEGDVARKDVWGSRGN